MTGRERWAKVTVTPTIGTDAYTIADVVGGLLTFDFEQAVPGLTGGLLESVIVVDDSGLDDQFDLLLFESEPTAVADDAASSTIAEADLHNAIGIVNIAAASFAAVGTPSVSTTKGVNLPVTMPNSKLYAYLIAREASNFTAADDLTITLVVRTVAR